MDDMTGIDAPAVRAMAEALTGVGERPITLRGLLAADTGRLIEVAREWERLAAGHGHCVAIAAAIREFAGDVEDNRRQLHGLVAEARRGGLWIDLVSGLITAPIGVAVDAYAQQIAEIVARVNDADRRTADVLDRHKYREDRVPEAPVGGDSSPTGPGPSRRPS
jgi:hypothetical protein